MRYYFNLLPLRTNLAAECVAEERLLSAVSLSKRRSTALLDMAHPHNQLSKKKKWGMIPKEFNKLARNVKKNTVHKSDLKVLRFESS